MKNVKIWNFNKTEGKIVKGEKFEEIFQKAKEKFIVQGDCKLVMMDGCEVDDEDSFLAVPNLEELFLLRGNERLEIPRGAFSITAINDSTVADQGSTEPGDNLNRMIDDIRRKRTYLSVKKPLSLNQNTTKKRKETIRVNLGWLVYKDSLNRYAQIKLVNGGGSRTVDLPSNANYDAIMTRCLELFVLGGNETNYEHVLGDFKKNLIQKDNFHLEEYVKTNCLTQKPRLYLMSKELPNVENNVNYPDYVSIDSDTSSLPDPADVEDVAPMTSSTAPAPTASSSAPAPTISSTATSETVLPTASTALPTASSTAPAETALSTASSNTSSPTTSLNNVDDFSLDETIPGFSGSFSSPMIEIRSIVCVVCKDRPIDSSLRPCGHTICAVCAAEIQERTQMCPICRAEFNDFYPIYI